MANELNVNYPSGNTLYAIMFNPVGQIYNTVTLAFETPQNANWTSYDITMTEEGTTQVYRATMPSVAGGVYYFVVRVQAGGVPAVTDTPVATGQIQWDGSAELSLFDINTVAFPAGAIEFTYTLTNSVTGDPIGGADVWISTDAAGTIVIWRGTTDVFGVARDIENNLPYLDNGVYYFWRQRTGFSFTNPDTETVS